MLRLIATVFLSLATFCPILEAQTTHPPLTTEQVKAIDQFVTKSMQDRKIPGVQVGVYSRGQVLLAKGYGMSDVELSVPVKPETVFQSGSVGKQFVSAAIMMLVEEGKINLDDSITKYFPNAPATWKPILVKNLLSHTSGLAEYESPERIGPNGPFYLRLDFTEDQLVEKVEALPIDFQVGEKWDYRNTNYLLLGIMIHKVTGKPYADFLQERIFKPLGMTSTRLISEADIIPNRASGYELHHGELKNQEWVSPTFDSTADGALYFNVLDLAKWDAALYGTTLLKQSSLDRMWTVYPLNDGKPNPANYGFGWMIDNRNGHRSTEHGGAWQGFTCFILRYPDDNLSVAVLTNLQGGGPGAIAKVVAGLINPALMPPKLEAIQDDQPALAESMKKLLGKLAAGEDVRSDLSTEMAAALTPDEAKDVQSELKPVWPPDSVVLVKRKQLGDMLGSVYRIRKGDHALLITYGLDKNGKVALFADSPDQEYQ
jgi:CubicO group peptidase (beta-lactamase class C family)